MVICNQPKPSGYPLSCLKLWSIAYTSAHAFGGQTVDSLAIPILLGLGLDEFSMNPPSIPQAKAIICPRMLVSVWANRPAPEVHSGVQSHRFQVMPFLRCIGIVRAIGKGQN